MTTSRDCKAAAVDQPRKRPKLRSATVNPLRHVTDCSGAKMLCVTSPLFERAAERARRCGIGVHHVLELRARHAEANREREEVDHVGRGGSHELSAEHLP